MSRGRLPEAAFACWTALVLVLYLAAPGHRPAWDHLAGFVLPRHGAFGAATLLATWGTRGRDLLVAATLDAAVIGAGALAAAWLAGARVGWLRGWLMGLAPAGGVLLGAGLVGLWRLPVLGAVVLAGAALLPRVRRGAGAAWPAALPALLALPAALCPETVFDPLRYHLALPDHFLRAGRIVPVERFLFASFPATQEMLYAPALAFGSTVAARLLHWQALPLTALALAEALTARLARGPALLLAAGLAATPFLARQSAAAGVDLTLMALVFGGAAAVVAGLDAPRGRGRWREAGWLFGAGCGVKYLGGTALLAAAAALVVVGPAARRAFLCRAVPVAALVALPWGLRNWLTAGNPVHPYLLGHFGLEAETLRRHLLYAADWRAAHPWWRAGLDLVPVALTRGTYEPLHEALAPAVFLVFALAALRPPRWPAADRWLAACSLLLWGAWAAGGGGIFRFLVPLFPVATLLVGRLLAACALPRRAALAAPGLALLAALPLTAASQYLHADPAPLLSGCETERDYLRAILPPSGRYLGALARGCATAGRGRLLVLGDPKAFYAPGPCVTEFEFAPPLLFRLAADCPSPARMRVALRQRGITALLYRVEAMISSVRLSGATLAPPALARYRAFWRGWAGWAWTEEHPAENCWYQEFVLRARPGAYVRPRTVLPVTLPGLEDPPVRP